VENPENNIDNQKQRDEEEQFFQVGARSYAFLYRVENQPYYVRHCKGQRTGYNEKSHVNGKDSFSVSQISPLFPYNVPKDISFLLFSCFHFG
jgi:hypothetical protein